MNPLFGILAFSLTASPVLRIERVLADSFTFKAFDGQLDSNVGTVTVAPTGLARTGALVATDADGDALTYSIVSQPAHGAVSIDNAATGTFTYTPAFDVMVTILRYDPGAMYHLQRSLDLLAWSDIPFIPNAAGTFIDRRVSSSQFYRVSYGLPLQSAHQRVRTISTP